MSTGSSDHPRSRGVYQTSSCTVISVVGSSPLARGLHHPADQPAGADGIIPARAGFTRVGLRRCGPLADHPRSRGVYGSTALTTVPTTGSSPLARGLPDGDGDGAVPGRIIPARAGFTTRKAGAETTRPDHPRSRGVYPSMRALVVGAAGSSPLARGLRPGVHASLTPTGIIPARAGFTRRSRSSPPARGDHPRSRGVYAQSALSYLSANGSSPLARGLRPGVHASLTPTGIIPARAGFTRRSRSSPPARGDHPRSRGVYAQSALSYLSANGSSPLARGLPREASRRRGGRGDHPRSRGVYQAYDC